MDMSSLEMGWGWKRQPVGGNAEGKEEAYKRRLLSESEGAPVMRSKPESL